MKTINLLIILLLTAVIAYPQHRLMQVYSEGEVAYEINTAQVDSVVFKIGLSLDCGITEISENEYLTMQVVPKIVSIDSPFPQLKMENHTNSDMIYGAPFCLEYFNENNWEPIQFKNVWPDIGYILYAGETTEKQIDLYPFVEAYNNSQKGKYRIIKTISPIGTFNNSFLCAEFEIK